MAIKKLRPNIRSKLESGLIITDATQCAMELVENALDAKATAVAVRINLKDYMIQVVDNGTGITPYDLKLIGKRFMTSKCHNPSDTNSNMTTFGYRGQAIASILDVCSKLIIKTKSELTNKTLVKVFTRERSPSISVSSKEKCDTGTTVTVCGFMSTMPVRQKRIMEIFDIQEIKKQLEYLAIIYNEVSFTLRDEHNGQIILQSQKRKNYGLSFADLFGMALGKYLIPINYTRENIEIQGFIGLQRHSENNLQFFYVNKRIISKSVTHKFLNDVIDSNISRRLTQALTVDSPICQGIDFKIGKCLHNVYLIQMRCPYSDYEIFRNLRKTTVEFKNWDQVFFCLKTSITVALNTETVRTDCESINCINENKKTEMVKNIPRKNEADLKKLKCGIGGVLIKRKASGTEDSGTCNCLNFVKKRSLNDREEVSGSKGIKNDACRLSTPLTISYREGNDSIEEVKRKMKGDLKCKEQNIGNDLIDFAIWLKYKMRNDNSIRKMYREFIKRRPISRGVNNSKLGIRRKEFGGKRKENEIKCEKIMKLYDETKVVKTEELSISNSINSNVKCFKRESKLNKSDGLKTTIGEFDNGLNTENENNFVKISPISTGNSFIQNDNKKFIYTNSDNLPRLESSKSWVSHENHQYLNNKYLVENICVESNNSLMNGKLFSENEIIATPFDTWTNKELKAPEKYRETEMQTSINVCDRGIQINIKEIENNIDNMLSGRRRIGEVDISISGNLFSDSAEEEKLIENINVVSDESLPFPFSAKWTNFKSSDFFFPFKNSKEVDFENVPDTLSVGDRPFTLKNRYAFIPKGLSPTVIDGNFRSSNDFISGSIRKSCEPIWEENSAELFRKCLVPNELVGELKEKTREKMIYYECQLIKTEANNNSNQLNDLFVDKHLLSNLKAIGQWDKKFIIGKTNVMLPEEKHLLFVFDQHAVDERIRLEKLLKESRTADGKFISKNCIPPVTLKINKSMLDLICSLENILLNFGIKISVIDSERALLEEIPICFLQDDGDSIKIFVEKLLNEIAEGYNETRGYAFSVPPVIHKMISTMACKSAVKFNQILSSREMGKMINDLILCQIPFQCAHGRPSLIPILDFTHFIKQVKKDEEKLNLKKFLKMKDGDYHLPSTMKTIT